MKNLFYRYSWEIMLFFLALIVRIPELLRMDFADFPEFYRDYYMAQQITWGHLPLLGPPSMQTNFSFGPVYYYFLTPLFWLSGGRPFSLILTGILFYCLSTVVFYKLLRLWFNDQRLSLCGAAFYAISVYGIHLTSYISNPNLLPLWVLVFIYFLSQTILQGPTRKNLIFLGFSYGIAAQLHTTAAIALALSAIVPFGVWILPKMRQQKSWINLFWAGLAMLLPASPYIYFELTSKLSNLRHLLSFGSNHFEINQHLFALQSIGDFFQSSLNPFFLSNSYSYIQPSKLYILVALAGLIVLGGLLISVFQHKIKLSGQQTLLPSYSLVIILGWFLSASASLFFFNKSPHDHYLIILWPLPIILLCALAIWSQRHLGIFKSLVFFYALISILQIYSFYSSNHPKSWTGFMPVYETHYAHNPTTSQIGSASVGWPQFNK